MLIYFIFGIISSIYLFKMVNILNKERIPTNSFEFIFSYDKFRKFIETCNGDEKIKYIKLYKKSLWFKRIPILLFLCIIIFMIVYNIK